MVSGPSAVKRVDGERCIVGRIRWFIGIFQFSVLVTRKHGPTAKGRKSARKRQVVVTEHIVHRPPLSWIFWFISRFMYCNKATFSFCQWRFSQVCFISICSLFFVWLNFLVQIRLIGCCRSLLFFLRFPAKKREKKRGTSGRKFRVDMSAAQSGNKWRRTGRKGGDLFLISEIIKLVIITRRSRGNDHVLFF